MALSGTVTSDTKAALSTQPDEFDVAVGAADGVALVLDVGAAGEGRFASDVGAGRAVGFLSGVDVPPAVQAESASANIAIRWSVLCNTIQPP